MRVLILSQYYAPESVPKPAELAEALAGRGHAVSVVTAFPNYPLGRVFPGYRLRLLARDRSGPVPLVRTFVYPYHGSSNPRRCVNYVSFMVSSLLGGLVAPRCDVVYVWHPPLTIGIAAWLIGMLKGAPVVYDVQDIWPDSLMAAGRVGRPRAVAALRALERFVYARARRVLVGTPEARANLLAKGVPEGKIHVAAPWVDESLFAEERASDAPGIRARYDFGEKFVVMYAGNMGWLQGLDTVIRCAALLRAEPGIVFVLVGDGVERAALEAQAAELGLSNVVFVGRQPMSAMPAWLASADALVVHFKVSAVSDLVIPGKTYAYLASARPIIMASAGAAAAFLGETGAGVVVPPENPASMADAVVRMARLPGAERRALGIRGRRYVLAHLSRDKAVEDHERMLAEALREVPTPRVKRCFDVLLSGLGLAGSLPLWALIALAIKIDDGGPVFYGQDRVGLGGRPFKSWKFRSMIPESDARFGPLQAKDADARVTPVGCVLRATAMDELPQLWNIFRGDMSFVGPRALMPEEIEVNSAGQVVPLEKIPGYEARHRVTPGLTGIAQIYADRDVPRRHKFRYDALYIRRRSFWLDLRLILLSFWITFRGRWERRGRKF